jgi:hypothetical protein
MARNRQTSAQTAQPSIGSAASGGANSPSERADLLGTQAWFDGTLVAPKMVLDSLLEMQRQWLKTACLGNEALSLELKELQEAKDPMQFVSTQISLANQQLEICTRQVTAILQQLYDAQLLWMGQWDDKGDALPSLEQANQSALSAMGRVHDEWLKVTQNWIESANFAGRVHH